MNYTVLQGFFVLCFVVFLLAIGRYFKKTQGSQEDYFLANHGNGVLMLTVCTIMGWIGAGDLVGVYGSGYRRMGLTALFVSLGFSLSLLFYAFVMCKRAHRVGNKYNCYTVSDIFRNRYGKGAGTAFSFFSVLTGTNLLAGQNLAVGVMLNLFFDIPVWLGTIMSLSVVYYYVMSGGLKAAMTTTFFQMWACLIGLVVVDYVGIAKAGGLANLLNTLPEGFQLNPFAGRSFWNITGSILPTFFTCFTYNSFYMRCFSAKTENHMQKACIGAFFCMCVYLVIAAIGIMLCCTLLPDLKNTDQAIYSLLGLLHPMIGTFFSAALMGAAMSSADEGLHGNAAQFTKSIYNVLINPEADSAQCIKVQKITMAVLCVAAFGFTIGAGGVLNLLLFAFSLLTGSFPVLISCWFWRRINNQGAIAGFIAGGVVAIIWRFADLAHIMPVLWASGIGSFTAMVIVSYMTPPPPKECMDFLDAAKTPFIREQEQPAA